MKNTQAISSAALETVSVPHLTGYSRTIAVVGWAIFAIGCFTLYIWSLPQEYRTYAAFEANTLPPPEVVRAGLAELGFPEWLYALIRVSSIAAVAFIFLATGTLIFWRRPDERPALLFSLQLLLFGAILAISTPLAALRLSPLLEFVITLAFATFFLSAYLLPDGRFVPSWTRWLVPVWFINIAGQSLFAGTPLDSNTWPMLFNISLTLLLAGSCIGALVYRYRRVAGPIQRQQIKWVIFGLAMTIIIFLAYWTPIGLLPALTENASTTALYDLIGETILILSFSLMPLTMGIAILRYRLWDIDPILNRTLVYGALTACVIIIYALVVGYFGVIFQVRESSIVSLLAAGVVAVLFQPLRERLQLGVNRLMYGQRDDPYAVISGLGRRLEAALTPEALLPTIVMTVREALKLPYVAITFRENGQFWIAAEEGVIQETLVRLSITYQTEQVGELVLAPRSPGEDFSSMDRRLLDDLARQASMAIQAVRMNQNLHRLNIELQNARVQLVTAREEERRRLARDLHDGFGSILASLNLRAGAIRSVLKRDPLAADALAAEQQETIRSTIADLRRLVHDLRPPVLDERGLSAALVELATQHSAVNNQGAGNSQAYPLQVTVELSEALPSLPAAVEVAAYRIVQEALTNVVRHARARTCHVRVCVQDEFLHVEVVDDGVGLPEAYEPGVGIFSMRERAMELGGYCTLERRTTGGTRVFAYMPVGVKL